MARAEKPWTRNAAMDYSHKDPSPRDSILMICQNCGADSNGPLYHCSDCNDSLCQSCVNAHRRVKRTKDHVIWRVDSNPSSINSSCSSLPSFNSSDTMDEIGTALFRIQTNSQASDTVGRPSKENKQNIVSELARSFLDLSDSGIEKNGKRNSLDTAEEKTVSVQKKWKTAESEIQDLMQMYRKRVDEREKELLNELTASVAVKTASLKREMSTYKAIQSSYERSMRILDCVLQKGRPYDILRAKEICDLEIQNARDLQDCALFPEEGIVFFPPSSELMNSIRHMGKISVHKSKIPPAFRPESQSVNPSSHPTQSSTSHTDEKFPNMSGDAINPPPKTNDENNSDVSNPKMNAWARPIKFTDEPKPIRAIIPHPIANPKVIRAKATCSEKFDYKAAGQPKMILGNEGNNDGELSRPWGVCCTNEGNIIVADRSNHRIQIFSPDGKFINKFGQHGKQEPGCFDRPAGVAVDPRGRIYVTDKDNHRIQVFTQDGKFVFMFGKEGKQNGQFNYPWGITVNSVGQVAVTDTRNQRIQMFSNNGSFLRKFGIENVFYQTNNLDSPRGICFNSEGNLVVTDFNNHRLLVIDSNFKKAKFLGGPGSAPKQFLRPQGVAVDNRGKIAIADSRNNRIQIINEDGTYVWQFGSSGTGPGQLDRPCGVCFTPDGKIVVVDFGNNRVQIF